jgi:hypothetical protein
MKLFLELSKKSAYFFIHSNTNYLGFSTFWLFSGQLCIKAIKYC